MALYKEHGVNPMSQFYLLLIQFPILIALYRVVWAGINSSNIKAYLYTGITAPTSFTHHFLGMDLAQKSILLALVAGAAQYLQAATAIPKPPAGVEPSAMDKAMKSSLYMMVGVMAVFAYVFPAVIALYLTVTNLFTFTQQLIVNNQTEEDIGKIKEWNRK